MCSHVHVRRRVHITLHAHSFWEHEFADTQLVRTAIEQNLYLPFSHHVLPGKSLADTLCHMPFPLQTHKGYESRALLCVQILDAVNYRGKTKYHPFTEEPSVPAMQCSIAAAFRSPASIPGGQSGLVRACVCNRRSQGVSQA